jgi:membrane-associated phospholipid phosphatase
LDYRLYHAVNSFVAGHPWLGHVANGFETAAVPVLAVATFALWFAARPGGARRWKLACGSALASGALALIVNQLVAKVWDRARPFATHPSAHVWGARSHDPSFPSDHASAAFGIAFAVLFFSRVAGALFIAAATLIAVGRVVVGAHYPADVAAGLLVGLASAVVVVKLARPLIAWLVRLVERLTDPIVAPVWRALR